MQDLGLWEILVNNGHEAAPYDKKLPTGCGGDVLMISISAQTTTYIYVCVCVCFVYEMTGCMYEAYDWLHI